MSKFRAVIFEDMEFPPYVFREYPKVIGYDPAGNPITVASAAEELSYADRISSGDVKVAKEDALAAEKNLLAAKNDELQDKVAALEAKLAALATKEPPKPEVSLASLTAKSK